MTYAIIWHVRSVRNHFFQVKNCNALIIATWKQFPSVVHITCTKNWSIMHNTFNIQWTWQTCARPSTASHRFLIVVRPWWYAAIPHGMKLKVVKMSCRGQNSSTWSTLIPAGIVLDTWISFYFLNWSEPLGDGQNRILHRWNRSIFTVKKIFDVAAGLIARPF